MANVLPRRIVSLPLKVACSLQPVASTSRACLSSSASSHAPRRAKKPLGDVGDEDQLDLSDLSGRARKLRPTGAPSRGETRGREADPTAEAATRFGKLHNQLNTQLRRGQVKNFDRAALNELLSLATTREQLHHVFAVCTHMRANAIPVERFYASDFYDRCIRYDAPRIALKAMASAATCGLAPTVMTHLWGALERLRVTLDAEDEEDCAAAIRNALVAIFQLSRFGLASADPFVTVQLMALYIRVKGEKSTEMFHGLDQDLRNLITPNMFARAYYETRRLHLREVSIFLDRGLTAVREHYNEGISSRPDEEAHVKRERLDYWQNVFQLIDSIRQSDKPPSQGPVWERPPALANGVPRGKYGGPVRQYVPYGTPMHRIAIVDGQAVTEPHKLNVLARSVRWKHGPRPEPRVLTTTVGDDGSASANGEMAAM